MEDNIGFPSGGIAAKQRESPVLWLLPILLHAVWFLVVCLQFWHQCVWHPGKLHPFLQQWLPADFFVVLPLPPPNLPLLPGGVSACGTRGARSSCSRGCASDPDLEPAGICLWGLSQLCGIEKPLLVQMMFTPGWSIRSHNGVR